MSKKITDGHKEQIRSMREDGKTYADIREFFQLTYKIQLYDSEIAAIMRSTHSFRKGVATNELSRRRKAQRKYVSKKLSDELQKQRSHHKQFTSEEIEFIQHIKAAWNIFKKKFYTEIETAIAKKEFDENKNL